VISDRYEVSSFVRVGGCAEIYRGKDIVTGEEVAIKVVLNDSRNIAFLK